MAPSPGLWGLMLAPGGWGRAGLWEVEEAVGVETPPQLESEAFPVRMAQSFPKRPAESLTGAFGPGPSWQVSTEESCL